MNFEWQDMFFTHVGLFWWCLARKTKIESQVQGTQKISFWLEISAAFVYFGPWMLSYDLVAFMVLLDWGRFFTVGCRFTCCSFVHIYSYLRLRNCFFGPDFALSTLCLPLDGIVNNFFLFSSFNWEFTRHTTFLVVSGSTSLPPNDRINGQTVS